MAAGCAFPQENLELVRNALHEYAGLRLTPEDFVPVMAADAEVQVSEITRRAVEEMRLMEPFGCANPEPLFAARGLTLAEVTPTRKPEHVRTLLRSTSGSVVGMGFNMGEQITTQMIGRRVDVAFQPMLEEWRGVVSLKWRIQCLCESSSAASQPLPALSSASALV
jgi:single-stranded-DNA-specific exonuclease